METRPQWFSPCQTHVGFETHPCPFQPGHPDPQCQHLQLKQSEVKTVVVHSPCNDGFAAALIASWARPDVKILKFNHKQLSEWDPKADDCILFADISPTPAAWTQMINDGKKFAIIDHHDSAEKDLADVPAWLKWFDSSQAACGMVWRNFFGDAPLPLLFATVQARDLFRKDDVPDCDAVITGLSSCAKLCAACWTCYATRCGELAAIGRILERKREDDIDNYVKTAGLRTTGRQRLWVVNCAQVECISDVGSRLVSREGCEEDIAFIFRYDMKDRICHVSLRSLAGRGPNVGQFAKDFGTGGGGHAHSAGFQCEMEKIEWVIEKDKPQRQPDRDVFFRLDRGPLPQ